MKENKYDDPQFFQQYSKMPRSVGGLNATGEWHELKKMMPNLKNKRVLDLGCGFGWHCIYAIEQGAKQVVGIDISENMLNEARKKTTSPLVEYIQMPIEDISYPPNSFDVVISSLAFHYIENFGDIVDRISHCLAPGGAFVFSVEHPVFTAYGTQDWFYDEEGNILHFPVDNYYIEGMREAIFLGEKVTKYHKTLTTYLNNLIQYGFAITGIVEPKPSEDMLKAIEEMKEELRRPMMFLVSAEKK